MVSHKVEFCGIWYKDQVVSHKRADCGIPPARHAALPEPRWRRQWDRGVRLRGRQVL